jgi:tetratricopeptide (TPR) repeat protein
MDAESQINRAISLIQLGRTEEAARILHEVIAADPTNASALSLLSGTYRSSNPMYAYQLALQAVTLSPQDSAYHYRAAWSAHSAKNLQAAIAHAQEVIRLDPDWSDGYQTMAQLLADQKGGYLEGMRMALKAIELAPEDPDAWVARSNVSLAGDDLYDARQSIQYALTLDPQHKTALYNLSVVNEADGKVGSAVGILQSLIRLDPRDASVRRRIDDLAIGFLDHLLWLAAAVGLMISVVVYSIANASSGVN